MPAFAARPRGAWRAGRSLVEWRTTGGGESRTPKSYRSPTVGRDGGANSFSRIRPEWAHAVSAPCRFSLFIGKGRPAQRAGRSSLSRSLHTSSRTSTSISFLLASSDAALSGHRREEGSVLSKTAWQCVSF